MKTHHNLYGKKLLVLPIILLLALSLLNALNVNITRVSAVVSPYIAVVPETIEDATLTPGKNFTVSIYTDYVGSSSLFDYITSYQFALSYNPSVLKGVEVVNGDLIVGEPPELHPKFIAGPFDNVAGELSLTWGYYDLAGEVTPGPGTLANVTFTVVDYGASNITIDSHTKLKGWWAFGNGHTYDLINAAEQPGATEPPYGSDHIQHGYFANGGSIAGKVTDASTGLPISGATVTAVGPETHSNTTAADGTYLLAGVPPGDYTVNASKPGYYSESKLATVFVGETTTGIDFTLQLIVGWINGTVTDALTGDPIYNATVTADGYSTTTDIHGEYTIPADLLPGNYTVEASKTDYYPSSKSATVRGGETTTVDFELIPLPPETGVISGMVTDALTEGPIEGADVTVNGNSTTTNIYGYYSIAITPGNYTVTASATGYKSISQTDVTVVAGEPTTGINFALTPLPGVINGTATDASTSLPIAGATVEAVGPETKSTTTDADGYYLIADVPPGDYTVNASAVGYYSNTTSATVKSEETTTVDFTLQAIVGWISGTVTENATKPKSIEGATVTAGDYSNTTDADGHYNIKVRVGTYNVTASKSGYYDGVETDVSVSENATTTRINFKLQLIVGWIDGYVTDANTGYPIFLATVSAEGVSLFGKNTGVNGYYKIEATPGVYAVNASKPGYISNSTSATVKSEETTTVDFTLQLIVGRIDGTVTDASTGDSIEGADVTVNGYNATTDVDGHYNITDVPAGTYTVTVSAAKHINQSKTATVTTGTTTTLDFELTPLNGTISGIVTDSSTGDPISEATVTANGMSATTNSSGHYAISDVPAGTYTVTVSANGYEDSSQTNITVVAGETTTVDFELTPAQPLDILLYAGVAAAAIIVIAGIAVYILKVRKPT